VKLWRIATETRKYGAVDLSGAGAAKSPGRWNLEQEAVVYAAPAIAMAVLETAAHIDAGGLPLNRFLVEIDVPAAVWNARQVLDRNTLPAAWCAIPAGRSSADLGSEWLRGAKSAILVVPSVVVPEEDVALINPAHSGARDIKAKAVRQFTYNVLFR
jgi:RES domain-containing protein